MQTFRLILVCLAFWLTGTDCCVGIAKGQSPFVSINGQDLIKPDGNKLFIIGTNLGNWLNPEGYMFNFQRTNSEWMINTMLCELIGPDDTREFWQAFKDNYITQDDIAFIKKTGANTIRLPFNYKLFTQEDYMGKNDSEEGFRLIDKVVGWCRQYGLYLILDMHDCPGGQTGDNIDNSYGYPWLFESETSQQQFYQIWRKIAMRYKSEPVILGYELMNEPIATLFSQQVQNRMNAQIEGIYKQAVKTIREVDQNHIVLLGGTQWNGNFKPFYDWTFDHKIMFTCHRYGNQPTREAIQSIIDFRDKTDLPMYMGEIGHNSDEWQARFCQVMRESNIGYTFWPYKKLDGSCMMAIQKPEGWDSVIVRFAEADRSSYNAIRKAWPNRQLAKNLLHQFIENSRIANCSPQKGYIRSMGLKAE